MSENNNTLLEFKNISKTFYGINALSSVGFDVRKGEVHALLGENGAGKSTLLNILTGAYQPDGGEIYFKGEKTDIKNPAMAKKLGINKVHQELQLVPELTVGQNICLGNEPKYGFLKVIKWRDLNRQATEVLDLLDADFTCKDSVGSLSTAQMQITEIAKALREKSVVLALDEPTSSLTNVEIEKLFEIIRKLKQAGTAIIYVSHRLDEVFQIADRLTVLRDGKYMGTYFVKDMNKASLIKLMVGRDIRDDMKAGVEKTIGKKILEANDMLSKKGGYPASFYLREGEILGFSGLVGSGRTELMRLIFGADPHKEGTVIVKNKKIIIKNPTAAVKQGIALIPEDRKRQGFVPVLTNRSNICLASLKDFIKGGVISRKGMKTRANDVIQTLRVNPPGVDKLTRDLSGGNQQKVVLGKWLSKKYKILIFDEPTRGIDVGAKSEIYKLMHQLAAEGRSIIMISSELPEILGMSDRIIVMHEGRIMGELLKHEASEEKVLHMAMGEI